MDGSRRGRKKRGQMASAVERVLHGGDLESPIWAGTSAIGIGLGLGATVGLFTGPLGAALGFASGVVVGVVYDRWRKRIHLPPPAWHNQAPAHGTGLGNLPRDVSV